MITDLLSKSNDLSSQDVENIDSRLDALEETVKQMGQKVTTHAVETDDLTATNGKIGVLETTSMTTTNGKSVFHDVENLKVTSSANIKSLTVESLNVAGSESSATYKDLTVKDTANINNLILGNPAIAEINPNKTSIGKAQIEESNTLVANEDVANIKTLNIGNITQNATDTYRRRDTGENVISYGLGKTTIGDVNNNVNFAGNTRPTFNGQPVALENDLSGLPLNYKGQVNTAGELPGGGQAVGDMYLVKSLVTAEGTGSGIAVWDGSQWNEMVYYGLDAYRTSSEQDAIDDTLFKSLTTETQRAKTAEKDLDEKIATGDTANAEKIEANKAEIDANKMDADGKITSIEGHLSTLDDTVNKGLADIKMKQDKAPSLTDTPYVVFNDEWRNANEVISGLNRESEDKKTILANNNNGFSIETEAKATVTTPKTTGPDNQIVNIDYIKKNIALSKEAVSNDYKKKADAGPSILFKAWWLSGTPENNCHQLGDSNEAGYSGEGEGMKQLIGYQHQTHDFRYLAFTNCSGPGKYYAYVLCYDNEGHQWLLSTKDMITNSVSLQAFAICTFNPELFKGETAETYAKYKNYIYIINGYNGVVSVFDGHTYVGRIDTGGGFPSYDYSFTPVCKGMKKEPVVAVFWRDSAKAILLGVNNNKELDPLAYKEITLTNPQKMADYGDCVMAGKKAIYMLRSMQYDSGYIPNGVTKINSDGTSTILTVTNAATGSTLPQVRTCDKQWYERDNGDCVFLCCDATKATNGEYKTYIAYIDDNTTESGSEIIAYETPSGTGRDRDIPTFPAWPFIEAGNYLYVFPGQHRYGSAGMEYPLLDSSRHYFRMDIVTKKIAQITYPWNPTSEWNAPANSTIWKTAGGYWWVFPQTQHYATDSTMMIDKALVISPDGVASTVTFDSPFRTWMPWIYRASRECESTSHYCAFAVADNGVGMAIGKPVSDEYFITLFYGNGNFKQYKYDIKSRSANFGPITQIGLGDNPQLHMTIMPIGNGFLVTLGDGTSYVRLHAPAEDGTPSLEEPEVFSMNLNPYNVEDLAVSTRMSQYANNNDYEKWKEYFTVTECYASGTYYPAGYRYDGAMSRTPVIIKLDDESSSDTLSLTNNGTAFSTVELN